MKRDENHFRFQGQEKINDMFLKSVVTHLAAPLKADIGTNSVKNRHAQNTNNEMKKRITDSNIKKEKLQLNEDTKRMKEFFRRKI